MPLTPLQTFTPLPKSCATCTHYDGDHYCSLPVVRRMLAGYIIVAQAVVCVEHQEKTDGKN